MVLRIFNQGCCVVKNNDYHQIKVPEMKPTRKNVLSVFEDVNKIRNE